MTSHRYDPDTHDPQLRLYHRMKLDDYLTAERFWVEHGLRFSSHQCRLARCRLGLHANRRENMPSEQAPRRGAEKPNPIEIAQAWLGNRLTITSDYYFIDGKRVRGLTNVMQETNRLREAAGQPQITTNPAWRTP